MINHTNQITFFQNSHEIPEFQLEHLKNQETILSSEFSTSQYNDDNRDDSFFRSQSPNLDFLFLDHNYNYHPKTDRIDLLSEYQLYKSYPCELSQKEEIIIKVDNREENPTQKINHKRRGRYAVKKSKYNRKTPHDKFSKDNLVRKIKVYLFKFLTKFINDCIKKEYGGNQRFKLRKMNNSIIQNSTIVFNQQLFPKTLREILSNDISMQYIACENNCNQKTIKRLMEWSENLKKLFSLCISEVYKAYIKGINVFGEIYKEEFEVSWGLFKIGGTKFKVHDNRYLYKLINCAEEKFIQFSKIVKEQD